jgi:metallo-beta-lactamase class B
MRNDRRFGLLKKTLRSISLLVFILGCTPVVESPLVEIPVESISYIEIAPDLVVRHIQDGVFEFTHSFPWDANSLAVVMGEHLVLVDTPYTPKATKEVLDWLETQVGPKDVIAINTHFHLDNLGGNQFLAEQGIPIYGSDLIVQLLADRGQTSLDQTITWLQANEDPRYAEVLSRLKLTPPTEIFNIHAGLDLEFGGEPLQVFYPGPGHTSDNVVVYFPAHKLLFGGCMIIGWEAIGNTMDADLFAWPASVRNLKQFEFDILVPGHGERLDPDLIEHTLDLLSRNQ